MYEYGHNEYNRLNDSYDNHILRSKPKYNYLQLDGNINDNQNSDQNLIKDDVWVYQQYPSSRSNEHLVLDRIQKDSSGIKR